ncbi:MAG: hypothetical protein STSR0004_00880 [Peptococcaceae bacterium]
MNLEINANQEINHEPEKNEEKQEQQPKITAEKEINAKARKTKDEQFPEYFADLPRTVIEYAQKSIIPPQVIEYYKQYGLDEQIIKILLHVQPYDDASYKPANGLPGHTC